MDEPSLEFPDLDILLACGEAEHRQQQIVPLLAATLGVAANEVFHQWAFRRCRQTGTVAHTPWKYRFHGYECDLRNSEDGRFLRVDFGPGGRLDTVSAWGVLQFIMRTTAPWAEFPALGRLFAGGSRDDCSLWDTGAFYEHWDRLEAAGCFAVADPALVELRRSRATVDPNGIQTVRFDPKTTDETIVDSGVAHRVHLSAMARRIVDRNLAGA